VKLHPRTEICDGKRHRELLDNKGVVGEMPALSFGKSEMKAAIGGGRPGLSSEHQVAGGREKKLKDGVLTQSLIISE
jgi:hypothetical protein